MRTHTKHGLEGTPTYNSWIQMKQRCINPNNISFKNYGARGITYSGEWELFTGFLKDMGEKPEGYSLDRIDNDKGYSKENCRWVTKSISSFNQRKPNSNLPRGVIRNHKRFSAVIVIEKIRYYLGTFNTPEQASNAYQLMCLEWHGSRSEYGI